MQITGRTVADHWQNSGRSLACGAYGVVQNSGRSLARGAPQLENYELPVTKERGNEGTSVIQPITGHADAWRRYDYVIDREILLHSGATPTNPLQAATNVTDRRERA